VDCFLDGQSFLSQPQHELPQSLPSFLLRTRIAIAIRNATITSMMTDATFMALKEDSGNQICSKCTQPSNGALEQHDEECPLAAKFSLD